MKERKRLGVALCGSYCTFDAVLESLKEMAKRYELIPVMSEAAASTDSRFSSAENNKQRLTELCGREPICSVAEAEPLGPIIPLDALLIAPCTGNTLGKLANGITDTSVTMAAKAHLRNGKPLIVAFSTNDGLSGSAENIGKLLQRKNVFFCPFRQDNPKKKPWSLQADFTLLEAAVEEALQGRQLQPVLRAPQQAD